MKPSISVLWFWTVVVLPGARSFVPVVAPFSKPHGQRVVSREQSTTTSEEQSTTSPSSAQTQEEQVLTTRDETEVLPWILDVNRYGAPDPEDWAWAYSTTPDEACTTYTVPTSNIEGTIPSDLLGTYYKTGPANFEREGRRYNHVLDGDGFVAKLSFEKSDDGSVSVQYTGRFVETEYYQAEREQNRILYRNVFGTQRSGGWLANAADLVLKNVANTNVLEWGKRLFCFWEAGRPYELDRHTLETLPYDDTRPGPFQSLNCGPDVVMRSVSVDDGGPIDRMAKMGRSFTAHPHVENDDSLVAFTFAQNPLTEDGKMKFVEYDANWNLRKAVEYTVPDCASAPHDFALSRDHYVFFQNRFNLDKLSYLMGFKAPTQVIQLQLNQPTLLHIVPRSSGEEALCLELPSPYFNIHKVPNIIQENGKDELVLYSNGWDLKDPRYFEGTSAPFLGAWGGRYPDFFNDQVPPGQLFRTVVDLKAKRVTKHEPVIPGLVMEFALQDEENPNYIYCSSSSTDYTSMPGVGLAKVDVKNNKAEYWWAENRIFTNEAIPVRKRNGDPGSWLLALLYDAGQRRTTLAILDSENFSQGPVCRIHLKYHLTYGLHGSFLESS